MKNRVYIYCIIFAVVFIAGFSFDVYNVAGDVKRGYDAPIEMPEHELIFKSSAVGTIHNKKTNKDIKIYRKNLVVNVDSSSKLTEMTANISLITAIIAVILLFPNIILALISICKKDIFCNTFEIRLSRIGFACIMLEIGSHLYDIVLYFEACKQVEIEGYYYKLFQDRCFTGIYIGLILLIGAQVFKMARTLKEEQELTI